jgi:hypothetical protein
MVTSIGRELGRWGQWVWPWYYGELWNAADFCLNHHGFMQRTTAGNNSPPPNNSSVCLQWIKGCRVCVLIHSDPIDIIILTWFLYELNCLHSWSKRTPSQPFSCWAYFTFFPRTEHYSIYQRNTSSYHAISRTGLLGSHESFHFPYFFVHNYEQ